MIASSNAFPKLIVAGLTGAVSGMRIVGANASGAPASGTFVTGDVAIDLTGKAFICTAGGTPGTWVQVGSSASLTSANAQLGSDVTMTSANTYYDGPSLSLAAGSWLVIGCVTVTAASAVITAKLWDGTTVYGSGSQSQGIASADPVSATLVGIVVPGTTITYKISAASTAASSALKAASNFNGAGNNASSIVAVKIG